MVQQCDLNPPGMPPYCSACKSCKLYNRDSFNRLPNCVVWLTIAILIAGLTMGLIMGLIVMRIIQEAH